MQHNVLRVPVWASLLIAAALLLSGVPVVAFAAPVGDPAIYPVETFDRTPVLASTQTDGAWYTDRYAPAGFAKATFDDGKRLKLSISSADSAANRSSSYSSTFYNTQGRNFDLATVSDFVTADLYIGADWDGNNRRGDLWANAVDSSGDIVGYPILGFLSGTGFRVWDNLGWHVVGLPEGFSYGSWYTLSMQRNVDSISYYVDDELVYTSSFADDVDVASTVGFDNVKLQAYNFGDSYDVYFDNVGPIAPAYTLYSIDSTVGAHGSASWSGARAVAENSNLTIVFTPDEGYVVEDVKIDGVSKGARGSWTFTDIDESHNVAVTFTKKTYAIVPAAGVGGTISPDATTTVAAGDDATFTFTPAAGYHVARVLVDGASVGAVTSYTFRNVASNHTISAEFAVNGKVKLSRPYAPNTAAKGKSFSAWGTLKPKHTSGTYPVRIYKYKKTSSGAWKSYGYVKAKASNYSTYTKFKASVRLTSAGTWRLRAYAPADSMHAATWSTKYDYVTVK